jgi:hypothetical protein
VSRKEDGVVRLFRFVTSQFQLPTKRAWIERVHRIEAYGYDVFGMPDHIGAHGILTPTLLLADMAPTVAAERMRRRHHAGASHRRQPRHPGSAAWRVSHHSPAYAENATQRILDSALVRGNWAHLTTAGQLSDIPTLVRRQLTLGCSMVTVSHRRTTSVCRL